MTESSIEFEQATDLSRRILDAANKLFSDQPVLPPIQHACSQFETQCQDIIHGRGLAMLTIAVIGAKGQGKTWVARQLILDHAVRARLPSGVLAHEATKKLVWIGSVAPTELDTQCERYEQCASSSLADLSTGYMLLDTPGATDADSRASEIAQKALSLTPIQLLVIRRDQLRSSTTSPIVNRSEGVLCVPIITAVSPREVPPKELDHFTISTGSASSETPLHRDLQRWIQMIHDSAPKSSLLAPVLIEDFEATGDEEAASNRLRAQLSQRLRSQLLSELGETREARLSAATARLKSQVHHLLETTAPQLSRSVHRLVSESQQLPNRVVESVLGSPVILETAVRARLRAQVVSDTSPIWFPYRTTISLLSMTQGAWDRLLLAMTGSIPSLFGTFVTWAKNVQQSRKIEWEMQEGLRERLNRQVEDQLAPMQQQFHRALSRIRSSHGSSPSNPGRVVLRGVEELQSRSQSLFESVMQTSRASRWSLMLCAMIGTLIFWALLIGPIVAIYRQYFLACYRSFVNEATDVGTFPHPSPAMLATSIFLSFIPLLLYSMLALTSFIRRSKIERISRGLIEQHHGLVNELQSNGILRLDFEDSILEKAQFLLSLESHGDQ
jgi:hypothetical protein